MLTHENNFRSRGEQHNSLTREIKKLSNRALQWNAGAGHTSCENRKKCAQNAPVPSPPMVGSASTELCVEQSRFPAVGMS